MNHDKFYQSTERMKEGNYVISTDDLTIRKCKMNEIPIGKVSFKRSVFKNDMNYKPYEIVPVKSIWYCGRLTDTIRINGNLYVRGESYNYIKTIVNGGSLEDFLSKKGIENELTTVIYELKRIKGGIFK